MNRMIRLMSGVVLVAAVAACNNDPSLDLSGDSGDPTRIQATPQIMFINQGESKNVLLRLTDDANFATPVGPYTVTDVGPGLTVVNDTSYRPDYLSGELAPNPVQTQHRYIVTAERNVATSFKVSNKGITQEITVTVIPTTLGAALSATSPPIGALVTITAPENLSFDVDNTEVTFDQGGGAPIITEITPTTITFLPFPDSKGPATITNVINNYSPSVGPRTITTSDSIMVPSIALIALSDTTPAIGQSVTVTAGAGQAFAPDATVSFPDAGGDAVILSQNATTITFIPIPGSTGAATIDGLILTPGESALFDPFTVVTSNKINVPAIDNVPTTVSLATPNRGQPVLVTLGGGFKFLGNSGVTIGGKTAAITAVSADSTVATIVPVIGASGLVEYTQVALGSLLQVPLDVPSNDKMIVVGTTFGGTTLPGGTDITNAPVITLPSRIGLGAAVTDMGAFGTYGACTGGLGGDSCRLYKIVVTETSTFDFTLAQNSTADLGLGLLDDTGTALGYIADNLGQSATPETGSQELDPGTYYLAVVIFDYAPHPALPTVIQLFLSRTD